MPERGDVAGSDCAIWPRFARIGSPGTSCVSANAIDVIPIESGTSATKRRATNRTSGRDGT